MKKLYVIVNPDGRTSEQIAEIREQVRLDIENGLKEDVILVLPADGIDDISANVNAIISSDITISTYGAIYNRDCRIYNFVASEYCKYGVHEEDWISEIIKQRQEERELDIVKEKSPDDENEENSDNQNS